MNLLPANDFSSGGLTFLRYYIDYESDEILFHMLLKYTRKCIANVRQVSWEFGIQLYCADAVCQC